MSDVVKRTGEDGTSGKVETRSGPPPTIRGYLYSEVVSALQKSIRRGDEEGALYWATELEASNFGEALWRRLRIIAAEDCGLAAPGLMSEVMALYQAWSLHRQKKDDAQRSWRLFTTLCVLRLVRSPKSRIVDHALLTFWGEIDAGDPPRLEIPDVALDKHTTAGKRKGRSWKHFYEQASMLINHETGELEPAPVLRDDYRPRAMRATGAGR